MRKDEGCDFLEMLEGDLKQSLLLPLVLASPSCLLRKFLDGVTTAFKLTGPRKFRDFLEGVCVSFESGDRRSKRPRTRPSFCGVGPKDLRWVGVWWADRGASYGSSKYGWRGSEDF